MSGGQDAPTFSVVVCTRNRKENIVPTAESLLAQTHPSFELLIVDQSDDDSTERAVQSLRARLADPERVRYFRRATPGKPLALNFAWQQARGRYLALTDDDCTCEADWLCHFERAFHDYPLAGAVFGQVVAAPHDPAVYFVAVNSIEKPVTIYRVRDYLHMPGMAHFGIGANMAVRRDALARVGGWDPCMGPGAKFGSGDDHDLTVRLLALGYGVRLIPESKVTHYGFRRWADVGRDMERIGGGMGAAFGKYLRCGILYWGALRMLGHFVRTVLTRLFQKQKGVAFPKGWVRGLVRGLGHPVNRRTLCYEPMPDADLTRYGDNMAKVVLREAQGAPSAEAHLPSAEAHLPPAGGAGARREAGR